LAIYRVSELSVHKVQCKTVKQRQLKVIFRAISRLFNTGSDGAIKCAYVRVKITTIEPDRTFYPAEAYHQNYLTLYPDQPYIAFNDIPKVQDLKKLFPTQYRDKPVLVKVAS
jgi:peptide methionine sulfoxide reductase MsrA